MENKTQFFIITFLAIQAKKFRTTFCLEETIMNLVFLKICKKMQWMDFLLDICIVSHNMVAYDFIVKNSLFIHSIHFIVHKKTEDG